MSYLIPDVKSGLILLVVNRILYLVAYDITCPRRLRKALFAIKEYACGGQKSVFECFLTNAERAALQKSLEDIMDEREDKVFILRLDPRCRVDTLGIARPPSDPAFFYQD